jgi:peptidyl-prolyl cis-trans isomerase C
MSQASAKHILVDDETRCEELKGQIESGDISFEDAAKSYSNCPSGSSGGDLGTFSRGDMVPEFDKVVFSGDIGVVYGPVATQFGYHLIEITSREG